jgi:hypothetical protein
MSIHIFHQKSNTALETVPLKLGFFKSLHLLNNMDVEARFWFFFDGFEIGKNLMFGRLSKGLPK